MDPSMQFLWSLIRREFDSWNVTFRIEQFSTYIPKFNDLSSEQQERVVSELGSEAIEDFKNTWDNRKTELPKFINFTEYLVNYVFNFSMETTTEPPTDYHIYQGDDLTDAEICDMEKGEMLRQQSLTMLSPSLIALVFLVFIKPRKDLARNCCCGRPSFVYPLNLIDEHGRRWAYCGAFVMMTSYLLNFFQGQFFWNPGDWSNEEFSLKFSWIKPFILILNIIHLGVMFYPIFACLAMRRYILANLLGLANAAVWIWILVNEMVICAINPKEDQFLSPDTIRRIVVEIPVIVGQAAVTYAFFLDFVINSYTWYLEGTDQLEKKSKLEGKVTLPMRYIEFLMTAEVKKPTTLKGRIKYALTYRCIPGFKYPLRILSTMIIAFVLLLPFASLIGTSVNVIFTIMEESQAIELFAQLVIPPIQAANITQFDLLKAVHQLPRYLQGIRVCFIFGNTFSTLFHVASMFHMVVTYRDHVRKVMRGDHTWHHNYTVKPSNVVVAGMRYSGYQIAYIMWGYAIMFVLLAMISSAIVSIFIIPITFGEAPWFLDAIIMAISTAIVSNIIDRLQLMTVKFGFLQDKGAQLALNNRRVYHAYSFFIFFLNLVVGAFSVLKRSLLSLGFGTVLLCRLDRCLLMRGLESYDAGFAAYMGMLYVDSTHHNAIVKGFIYILQEEVKDSQQKRAVQNGDSRKGPDLHRKRRKVFDKRIRNKWWKLITLINNPDLVLDRLKEKVQEQKKNRKGLADEVINTVADVGAFLTGAAVIDMLDSGT